MPVNLHVRNVDDAVARRLKVRAAENGRSAEAEHRLILERALIDDRRAEALRVMEQSRRATAGIPQTPSEVLVRQTRDEN
jgi:plasmid stability protein